MSWEQEWIMEHYDLPFLRKGLCIKCGDDVGKITGFKRGHLIVKLTNGEVGSYHPTWNIVYLDGNEILKDFTK